MLRRRGVTWILLAAIGIVAVLAIFSLWAARQLLDQDSWEKTNTELIQNATIRDSVAVFLVDQLYANVDVTAELSQRLPDNLQRLAGPVAGALREAAERLAKRALATPAFQNLWATAVSVTHQQVINLIEDRGTALRLPGGGAVILDLRPLLGRLTGRLGLSPDAAARLPVDSARIKILDSEQVDLAQKGAKWLKRLTILFLLLMPVLVGLAVYLARGRRRETALAAALVLVGAALLVLVARRAVGNYVVDALTSTAAVQAPAGEAYEIATSLLRDIARVLLVLAVILAVAAWLAGPARYATRAREWLHPALAHSPGAVYGVVIGVLLLLLVAGLVPGIERPLGAFFVLMTAVASVELVRRQALTEHPGGSP